MDRNIVYPGSIPLDTDLLNVNRNAMIALGYLAQAMLGTGTVVDGLICSPTVPASLTVTIGPGSIASSQYVDVNAYGSLPADTTDPLVKIGINLTPTSFTLTPPGTPGQSVNYLIEALFQEIDVDPVVLPYYNAANPAQPYSGPSNSGAPQSTQRIQRVGLQLKAGASANSGSQVTPAVDPGGWVGLYVVTVSYNQTAITAANIFPIASAPFIRCKLPTLGPGFASGVQSFTSSGTFIVPAGVIQLEVEVWGGGSGSFASAPGVPSGGGGGGGYARKRVTGLTPGAAIAVTVGTGGAAGTTSVAPSGGGLSSFGSYVSASGGTTNASNSVGNAPFGNIAGSGSGGDTNIQGGCGGNGFGNYGGLGGGGAQGGGNQSVGNGPASAGLIPGGGASGAGTGSNGSTAYPGNSGASGYVVVRW
jgi:hypothetical protein